MEDKAGEVGRVVKRNDERRPAFTESPERWMTIRVYRSMLYTTGAWGGSGGVATATPLREEDIHGWVGECSSHGITSILWQANCGGTFTHPSPVFPLPGPPLRPHNEAWAPVWGFLGEQVRRFDTLEVAIAAAHEHGLRFGYALCLWDFVDSPFEESAFHPNLWMLSREGEPFLGVPCYAEPEAQDLILEHVRDALERGVDDLVISPFAHTQGGGADKANHYGFNPPLLRAYRERYGVEPGRLGFDPAAWHALYGELYTGFLHRLHQETSGRGQRLIAFTTRDGRWGWGGKGGQRIYERNNLAGAAAPEVGPGCGIEMQWRRWVEEGVVEALLVMAAPPAAVEVAREVWEEARRPVLLWRKVSAGDWEEYRREAAQIAVGEVDGYVIHPMFVARVPEFPREVWDLADAAAGEGAQGGLFVNTP